MIDDQSFCFSENQVSDSDDMDTQTTSSHAESGDAVVCNDEAAATESAEGGEFLSVLFLKPRYHCDPLRNERRQKY